MNENKSRLNYQHKFKRQTFRLSRMKFHVCQAFYKIASKGQML